MPGGHFAENVTTTTTKTRYDPASPDAAQATHADFESARAAWAAFHAAVDAARREHGIRDVVVGAALGTTTPGEAHVFGVVQGSVACVRAVIDTVRREFYRANVEEIADDLFARFVADIVGGGPAAGGADVD